MHICTKRAEITQEVSLRFDAPTASPYGPAVLPELAQALQAELRDLAAHHRLRACPPLAGSSRSHPTLDGKPVLSFSSNDYLGLATHPALARAAAEVAARVGFGAGASRLVSGDLPEHRALEAELADFLGLPSALFFPTGYHANLAVLTSLAGKDDLVVSDAANHASIIDGCRLSRATVAVYPHRDVAAAQAALNQSPAQFRRRLLVTESLFSMEGDLAPLADLAEATRAARAVLVVDEAHAFGALGPAGRGLCRAAGVTPDVLVGTLGKAFGASGGFVAGHRELRDYLVNRARTFVFTTAPPPPLAAAARAAIAVVSGPEGEERRRSLQSRIAQLGVLLARVPGFAGPSLGTPIFPLVLGPDQFALAATRRLSDHGIFVQAIRPPTVPEGTARLRVTLSAAHTPEDVASLAEALSALARGAAFEK
jgi:8-amino-7-oxononanoate synthase